MECSEKPIFHNYTRQELAQIRITAPEEAVRSLVKKHWDTLAKPLDGMGSFESITAQIGAILGTEVIDIHKKGVLIFCADNGIVEEGVTQSGQEVTLAVAKSMARKGSSVCRIAAVADAEKKQGSLPGHGLCHHQVNFCTRPTGSPFTPSSTMPRYSAQKIQHSPFYGYRSLPSLRWLRSVP